MNKERWSFGNANGWLLLLLVTHTALAVAFSMNVPIYEAPDEPGHFQLILHIVETGSLPEQNVAAPNYAHHPPLYYLLAALPASLAEVGNVQGMPALNPNFVWSGDGDPTVAFHHTAETFPYEGQVLSIQLARLVSVAAGAVTVLLTGLIGRSLFPGKKHIGLLAAAIVAFNPQLLFVTGTVNNDSLLIAASTGTLWQTLRTLQSPERAREWLFLGMWSAAVLLSKSSGSVILVIVPILWLFLVLSQQKHLVFLKNGIWWALTVSVLAGWWFVRNQLLYGDPFGWQVYRRAWSVNLRKTPLAAGDLPELFTTQFKSFWGVFGWMNVYLPQWLYLLVGSVLLLGLAGFVLVIFRHRGKTFSREQKLMLLLFVTAILCQELFLIYQNSVHNATLSQGRFLLPVIAALTIVVSIGLTDFFPRRVAAFAPLPVALFFLALSVYALVGVIIPVYDMVPETKLSLLTVEQRTHFTFGDTLALRGYEIDRNDDGEATQLQVRLYWEALVQPDFDYSVFVHAVDDGGQLLAQADHAPGASRDYLPVSWRSGDIVAGTWALALPGEWVADRLQLRVGVYNWQTGQRLPASTGADFVVIPSGQ